jgi:hypothetical protein
MKTLILVALILTGGYAAAQTTTCMTLTGGITTCNSFGFPDYSGPPLVDYYTPAIIQLETALAFAPAQARVINRAVDIVVITRCGHYKMTIATYADGSVKTVKMHNKAVDTAELAGAQAAIPMLQVVDIAECE